MRFGGGMDRVRQAWVRWGRDERDRVDMREVG